MTNRQTKASPREIDIKCALIDHLRQKKKLLGRGAVVASEMVVGQRTNRADLVIANGHALAFEIKSAADRLVRLAEQLRAFQRFFDKVIVVAAPRHVASIKATLPELVELWSCDAVGTAIRFKIVRRGKLRGVGDKGALLSMLRVEELRSLLRMHGINPKTDRRLQLEEKAKELSLVAIRGAVNCSLKNRYGASYQAFREAVSGRATTRSALALLSPHSGPSSPKSTENSWSFLLSEDTVPEQRLQASEQFHGAVSRPA